MDPLFFDTPQLSSKLEKRKLTRLNTRLKKQSMVCCTLCAKHCHIDDSYSIQGGYQGSNRVALLYSCKQCVDDFSLLNFDPAETTISFTNDEYFLVEDVFKTDD